MVLLTSYVLMFDQYDSNLKELHQYLSEIVSRTIYALPRWCILVQEKVYYWCYALFHLVMLFHRFLC